MLKDIKHQKQELRNSLGISDQILPRESRKVLAIYQGLDVGSKDPLTGEEIIPPDIVIPSTFTIYDEFERDPSKRYKTMEMVDRIENRYDSQKGESRPHKVLRDIIMPGGFLIVNIRVNYLLFVHMELNPLNIRNQNNGLFPDKVHRAAFRRIDKEILSIPERIAREDLRLEAEVICKKLNERDKIMSLAVSAKIPIENRKITDVHFDLREFAKNHPRDFFTLYPNKFTKAKVDVLDAQQLELLEYDPETHSWKIWDEKEAFHKVPVNEDPIKDLINFLCNEKDGELAHEMIREAINREEGKYS